MITMEKYFVAITTTDNYDVAKRIASVLLNKRLAACVNIIPKIKSFYWWKGNIEESEEYLLMIKTREELIEKVKSEVLVLHNYEVAEFIAFPIENISVHYASWIDKETNKIY